MVVLPVLAPEGFGEVATEDERLIVAGIGRDPPVQDHLPACVRSTARSTGCHLLFRDYLRSHPETTAAYAALKRQLAAPYRVQRDVYTEAKGPCVRATMARAEEWARMSGWAVPERQA
jgi:GrpB-like predicted nucleotidyltransferase (UPF0157 family)